MDKIITMRFPGKCKRCGNGIAAQERAIWHGSKRGVSHLRCKEERVTEPVLKSPVVESTTVDYLDVVSMYRRMREDYSTACINRKNERAAHSLAVSNWPQSKWVGCTHSEMDYFISDGYRVPGLGEVSSLIPAKPRRKLIYGEDGDELLLELAWAGSDTPFQSWEKRFAKPGLSLEVGISFAALVDPSLIAEYQKWVARALQTFDENAVDLDVVLTYNSRGMNADRRDELVASKTRVKKAGEASDFNAWSAMFSPGGLRLLQFTSALTGGDRAGFTVSPVMGYPQPAGKWDIIYRKTENVLSITESWNGPFPEFEMTQKLVKVLQEMNG